MCRYSDNDREIIAASSSWQKLESLASAFGVKSWTVKRHDVDGDPIRTSEDGTIRIIEVLTII